MGVSRGVRHENSRLHCYDMDWSEAGCGNGFGGAERIPRDKEGHPSSIIPSRSLPARIIFAVCVDPRKITRLAGGLGAGLAVGN